MQDNNDTRTYKIGDIVETRCCPDHGWTRTELAADQDVRLFTTLAGKFPRSFRAATC